MNIARRVPSAVMAVLIALSTIGSLPVIPAHAATECDQLLNDLHDQLSGLEDALANALTDLNEQDTANLDVHSKALDVAMDAWNNATTDEGRSAARQLADQDYANYLTLLDGLKQEAKEATNEYRQALDEARAKYKAAGCPKTTPAPLPGARTMQLTFKGTEQLQQAGGPGNLVVQFAAGQPGQVKVTKSGADVSAEADVAVTGSVVISMTIPGEAGSPGLSCSSNKAFRANVHVQWAVVGGKSQPLTWTFVDRGALPTVCSIPLVGDTLRPDDYLPAPIGEPDDENDIPAIPLQGADPDAAAVLQNQPFSVHYTGSQPFSASDSGGPYSGTRTYDLVATLN